MARRVRQPTTDEKAATLVNEAGNDRRAEELDQALVDELRSSQEELLVQQNTLLDTQRSLEQAQDRYAELFDFAPIAYVLVDGTGLIKEANFAATHLLGTERKLLVGLPLLAYIAKDQRRAFLDLMTRCRREGGRNDLELTLAVRGRDSVPVQLITSSATMLISAGLFHIAILDLSARRQAEEERERALQQQRRAAEEEARARAASAAKDRFIAILSHELRTPLTPILLTLDLLKTHGVPPAMEPMLAMIYRNVMLETRLIDDLLDMSRIVQGKMSIVTELVDTHEIANDSANVCHDELQRAGLEFHLELGAHSHHVNADPARLRQVIWNLLRNAIRNTPKGRSITLRSSNAAPGWITLSVIDTGRGIDAAMLHRIFEFFEQDEVARDRGVGLGLGLPISKSIVEAHGGHISAESGGSGKGSVFSVELRTTPKPEDRLPIPATTTDTEGRAQRILLVEDSEDSASALAEFLGMHGYIVQLAASVQAALPLVDNNDLLVSDIALPDGTGHDLMRQIREHRLMRGIALSGFGTAEDMKRSIDAGFERHLVKPVEPHRLLEALENLTRG